MAIKRVKNKITYVFLALFLLVVTIIGGRGIIPAFADNSSYTSVLTDLQKDSSFNANNYPDKFGDYSINVIQIAESVNGELFVYTYQPCQKTEYLVATQVNMSLSESTDGTKLYDLEFLSSDGVFCKYKVSGLTVKSDDIRYYNITSIYRKYDEAIDKDTGNDNKKKDIASPVGKCFKAKTKDGAIVYTCTVTDVIEIKNPFVAFMSYGDSQGWDLVFGVTNWTDIHYVAFSPDRQIDELQEADVTYTTQSYHYTEKNEEGYTYGEKSIPQYLTLTGKEEYGVEGHKQYVWKSIYRSADFIEKSGINEAAKKEVEKAEFVLVFLTTPFKEETKYSLMQGHYKEADGTKVSDVAILRLKFVTDGVVYNLGTVMDKMEGGDNASNKPDAGGFSFWKWLANLIGVPEWAAKVIFFGVIGLLLFGVLCPILGAVFPPVGVVLKAIVNGILKGLRYLFYGIAWLICLPFRALSRLIKKIRGD